MIEMYCPPHISNMTYAKCIGDFQINSPEVSMIGLLLIFVGLPLLTWITHLMVVEKRRRYFEGERNGN